MDSAASRAGQAPAHPPADSAAAQQAAPRPPLAPGFRSIAVAKGFRLEADSLEAILPDQRLRQVHAVGSARGESWDTVAVRTVQVDSGGHAGVVTVPPPHDLTEPPAGINQKDVLTADTIIAFFRDSAAADSANRRRPGEDSLHLAGRPAAPPPAPGDTAKTEIERLLAIGNAHSLYRMRNDSTRADSTKPPGLNYLIGDRIDLTFKGGEVDVARVLGLKQGMYLDPAQPGDSTAATDSAGRGRARPGAPANAGRTSTARGTPPASSGATGATHSAAPTVNNPPRPPTTAPPRTAPSAAPAPPTGPVSSTVASPTRAPVVRAGGLRVVVAAVSTARREAGHQPGGLA